MVLAYAEDRRVLFIIDSATFLTSVTLQVRFYAALTTSDNDTARVE